MNNILAIDPATTTGWAMKDDSGIVQFIPDKGELPFQRIEKFYDWLINIVTKKCVNFIVYERPGGRNYNGLRSHSNLEGIILLVCYQKRLGFLSLSASEIKKFATGNGNAKKEQMIEAYQKKFGLKPLDHNECDARWIYEYINSEKFTF